MNLLTQEEVMLINGGKLPIDINVDISITGEDILNGAGAIYHELGNFLHDILGCPKCWGK